MGVKLIVVAAILAAGIVGVVGTRPAEGDPGQTLRFVAAPPLAVTKSRSMSRLRGCRWATSRSAR